MAKTLFDVPCGIGACAHCCDLFCGRDNRFSCSGDCAVVHFVTGFRVCSLPIADFFATAFVKIESLLGRSVVVRTMLDQGSKATFVSESLVQTLHFSRIRMPTSISGVDRVPTGTVRQAVTFTTSPVILSSKFVSATAFILLLPRILRDG